MAATTRSVSRPWWPADLGPPTSTGSQNNVRYAYFAEPGRLAIELHGKVTVIPDRVDQRGGARRLAEQRRIAGPAHGAGDPGERFGGAVRHEQYR